jgi:hypothetical protein
LRVHADLALLDRQFIFNEPAHRARVNDMFLYQHARRQGVDRIIRQTGTVALATAGP